MIHIMRHKVRSEFLLVVFALDTTNPEIVYVESKTLQCIQLLHMTSTSSFVYLGVIAQIQLMY